MVQTKPTAEQITALKNFNILEPPPTFAACSRVLAFILGRLGQSREPVEVRAARYVGLHRQFCGQRVLHYGKTPALVLYLTIRSPDMRVAYRMSAKHKHGPIVARIRFDDGKSTETCLSHIQLLPSTE